MKISKIIWLENIVEKILEKHRIITDEVEQVLKNKPKFRLVEKGFKKGENVYSALGKSNANRFITVFFIFKEKAEEALIITAREMTKNEKRRFEKK